MANNVGFVTTSSTREQFVSRPNKRTVVIDSTAKNLPIAKGPHQKVVALADLSKEERHELADLLEAELALL